MTSIDSHQLQENVISSSTVRRVFSIARIRVPQAIHGLEQ